MAAFKLAANFLLAVSLLIPSSALCPENGDVYKVPAIGRWAHLGQLYDARNDDFIATNVFNFEGPIPNKLITTTDNQSTVVKTGLDNTLAAKFKLFDIQPSFGASILSGLIRPEGSASFLNQGQDNTTGALILKFEVLQEHFKINSEDLTMLYNTDVLNTTNATHILAGITWGANLAVLFKNTAIEKNASFIQSALEAEFKKFTISAEKSANFNTTREGESSDFVVSVMADIQIPHTDQGLTKSAEIQKLIQSFPQLIVNSKGGKGVPVEFTLTPLGPLKECLNITISNQCQNQTATKVNESVWNNFITVFDTISSITSKYLKLTDADFNSNANVGCDLNDMRTKISNSKTEFISTLKETIVEIRSGTSATKFNGNYKVEGSLREFTGRLKGFLDALRPFDLCIAQGKNKN